MSRPLNLPVLTAALLALLMVLLAGGPATAHGAPDTEEYEEWLVGDYGWDLTLFAPTGYELDNIIYAEQYLPEHGGHGLAVFIDLYGGNEFLGGTSHLLYEFDTPSGTVTRHMTFATDDLSDLAGDGVVLATEYEPYGTLGNAAIASATVFFTLDDLGMEVGDELATMRFATAWDIGQGMWMFDRAPGGSAIAPAPAPLGDVLIPEGGDETPIPARQVHGGDAHLHGQVADGAFTVTNVLRETEQHVTIQADGVTVDVAVLAPGESVTVAATGAMRAFSDIGGHAAG